MLQYPLPATRTKLPSYRDHSLSVHSLLRSQTAQGKLDYERSVPHIFEIVYMYVFFRYTYNVDADGWRQLQVFERSRRTIKVRHAHVHVHVHHTCAVLLFPYSMTETQSHLHAHGAVPLPTSAQHLSEVSTRSKGTIRLGISRRCAMAQ